MTDIALTLSQRTNIAALVDIQELSDRTSTRLTTGRKVNSVIDDAVSYFTSKNLTNRATDFDVKKSEIDQGISALTATLEATEAIETYLQQMIALAEAARSQSTTERNSTTVQFNQIGNEIGQLVEDASYRGFNLLSDTNNDLTVRFSDRSTSRLVVGGYDFNSTENGAATSISRQLFSGIGYDDSGNFLGISALGLSGVGTFSGTGQLSFSMIGAENSQIIMVDFVVERLENAITRLRAASAELGSNVAILQNRLNFTMDYVDTLEGGSDKLTLADMNEEGANITALQTRQQLGIQALSIAGDQQASVLNLLR